jgi:hypothetical protein
MMINPDSIRLSTDITLLRPQLFPFQLFPTLLMAQLI